MTYSSSEQNASRNKSMHQQHPERDEPVYWFVLLEKAVHRGDFDYAAMAKRELARLGVSVTHCHPKRKTRRGNNLPKETEVAHVQ
jgi:hypothetical protein